MYRCARKPAPLLTGARSALVLGMILSVALQYLPWGRALGLPFLWLSTLLHELGHGVAGVLVGSTFTEFHMSPSGAGTAHVVGHFGRFQHAFIAAGGLVGPAIGAAIFFALGRTPVAGRYTLGAFGLSLLILDMMVVRGAFALAFVGIVGVLCAALAWKSPSGVARAALIFLAVQLALSVYSRSDYLFKETVLTADRGLVLSDVGEMAKTLCLPYWFWGGVCAAVSAGVLVFGLKLFLYEGR